MKTLILIRHAKSSWDSASISDSERPLNERGKKDAPEMARRLKEKLGTVDLLISSPAKRAWKTARIFAEELNLKKDEILLVDELYMATQSAFIDAVSRIDDR